MFKVNIADFSRTSTVGDLLWSRFTLHADRIDEDLWQEAGIRGASQQIRHVSLAAIYRLVYLHVSRDWQAVSADVQKRRDAYASMLEEMGVDFSRPSALVDIGYKGTITKIVGTFFDRPVLPLFMATYPDEIGDDPIGNGRAFLAERMAPTRQDTFRRFNLIIETLLNEAAGSLVLVDPALHDTMDMFREASPSEAHLATISRIHGGVVTFAEEWYDIFGRTLKEPRFETNKLLELLDCILSSPTVEEAALFSGLEFDNNFSGHQPRFLVPGDNAAKDAVWKEGALALSHPVTPFSQRHELIGEGAFCSYRYDVPVPIRDVFTGRALFGAGGRGKTMILDVPHFYNWVHEEVAAFETDSDILEDRPMALDFVQDSHFSRGNFRLWQNGARIDYDIERPNDRNFSLRFNARPKFPVVVQNPDYRTARDATKDARRFYWRFLSLKVMNG